MNETSGDTVPPLIGSRGLETGISLGDPRATLDGDSSGHGQRERQ